MRKLALISAAALMSVGSIGSAAATVNTPFSAPVSSASGVNSNGFALGLAQPGQDDQRSERGDRRVGAGWFGGTSIIVVVFAVVAVGLGIYVAVHHRHSRPTSA